ncbi:MAG TPA: DUF4870 domain-containing protein [Terriglobales bacterium]|nr:DUF4870 domain-containing protein [Terriglobales bacterium]
MEATPVTQDERTFAVLAHALQIVGTFIAPLIILLVKRDSRFVTFHALQAVFLQLVYMVIWVVFFVGIVAVAILGAAGGSMSGPPPAFVALVPLAWLLGMMGWAAMLILAIVYAIKAGKGEWAEYPVLGRMARGMLGF